MCNRMMGCRHHPFVTWMCSPGPRKPRSSHSDTQPLARMLRSIDRASNFKELQGTSTSYPQPPPLPNMVRRLCKQHQGTLTSYPQTPPLPNMLRRLCKQLQGTLTSYPPPPPLPNMLPSIDHVSNFKKRKHPIPPPLRTRKWQSGWVAAAQFRAEMHILSRIHTPLCTMIKISWPPRQKKLRGESADVTWVQLALFEIDFGSKIFKQFPICAPSTDFVLGT